MGQGGAKLRPDAEARQRRLAEEARRLAARESGKDLASSRPVQADMFEVQAEPVTRAVVAGRDGRVYFLVRDGSTAEAGMTLERFEPASGALERLALAIPDPGLASMAAGKDGLYIASILAQAGIWRLTWEELEDREWVPVEEVSISSGSKG